MPPGMEGEIWVGGVQVARGYLGDEELTGIRFVQDPDDFGGSSRCYRTGDMGAWMPDGNLVFLGRRDRQLKVGGRRVEPVETEAAISRVPGVSHVHVSGELDAFGHPRLAAWVGVEAAAFPGITEMHTRISAFLPPHLLPSVVRIVDQWPLDLRGKTDTSALRRMVSEAPPSQVRMEMGEDARSSMVRSVWEEVLGSAALNPHDDFFRSGGHSLLALRFIALLRERMGLHIRLADFYRTPTLSSIASLAFGRSDDQADAALASYQDANDRLEVGRRLRRFIEAGGA
jgi:arthrofactin-type cyclic lipopeptide synthetase C